MKFGFKLASLMTGLYNISHANTYNWQQHIPENAKQFIPSCTNNATDNNCYGVSSLMGPVNLSTYYGSLTLNEAEVKTDLTIFGQLLANNSNFNKTLTCNGPLTLNGNNNILSGVVQVKGPLFANAIIFQEAVNVLGYIVTKDCTFKKSVIVHTSKIELENTTLEDLIINDRDDKPAVIILNNVKVNGKILIASGQGNVVIKNCQIDPQQIIGYQSIENK